MPRLNKRWLAMFAGFSVLQCYALVQVEASVAVAYLCGIGQALVWVVALYYETTREH